ncbi:MAG: PhoPQ-activated protein PqaA family protein [Pirellulales bacterium]
MAMQAPSTRGRGRRFGTMRRRLILEPLEERRLLDAGLADEITLAPASVDAPWQNPVFPLDVNDDSLTSVRDAFTIVNRILGAGLGDLPDPGPGGPQYFYDTSGDNRLTAVDLIRVVNAILSPPTVHLTSLTPYTVDVTPLVTVTASGPTAVPDGAVVDLDVDLNNDGDFADPGEYSHTQSTLFDGSSTFQITPALARTTELYDVRLRARVKNASAVPGSSPVLNLGVDTLTSDALENYVYHFDAIDASYFWEPISSEDSGAYTYHVLRMRSQTWRSTADVNIPEWWHYLGVYVPNGAIGTTALMLIDGGRNTSDPPANSPDDLGLFAAISGTVVLQLRTVPNEPVIFTDETISRTEDEIIAYTYDKFLENIGQPGNETWPLLLPMVKSAVRAMDTIQDFVPTVREGASVDEFVVFGGSKRGWTTWLTAAVDDRVRAIMPGVIDLLNLGPQMVHHYSVYGFFSEEIRDYQDLQIFDRLLTDEMRELSRIVDPYRYLHNGRFDDMPKLLVNSAGDEFFVSDSAQFYINDIPGDLTRLRYLANTGHGLDDDGQRVIQSVASFYGSVLLGAPLPEYSWTVEQNGEIHVQTADAPTQVLLWQATNLQRRDFRHGYNPQIIWTSTPLSDQGGGTYVGDVEMPPEGATAYFVELTFDSPIPGFPHVFTSEVRVKSTFDLYPWPFGAPDVLVSTLTPDTIDVTPLVTVTATGAAAIDDGTVVNLDVDLNNDGDFSDPGELGHTQSTLFDGSSTFQITPALERATQLYTVNLRARVTNFIDLEGISPVLPLEVDTLTSTALEDYVTAPDPAFSVSAAPVSTFSGTDFTVYAFDLKSQTWRSADEVDRTVWQHWLQLIVPTEVTQSTALLNIDGGNNTVDPPDSIDDDGYVAVLGQIAAALHMIVVHLPQVPNEPLQFPDDPPGFTRHEDEIIAYTFDKFLENIGQPGNETWPLLLPMVKSAVAAMDAAQMRDTTVPGGVDINDFIVTGASKRGWTTWLTAAADDRVRAIIPAVIDVLNMAPQMVHHYGVYGFFSEAIEDYENLQIFDRLLTDEGRELSRIVDPYRYLTNGRFDDLPKLLLNSAGDEFFVTDSSQFYIHDLPGDQNYLRYIPNTGHGLDVRAVESSLSFCDAVLNDRPLPTLSWTVEQNGEIHVQTADAPTQVLLWQATNLQRRDFRHGYNPQIIWTSTPLSDQGGGTYLGDVPIPSEGATAYFVELTFPNPVPGLPAYVFTTEARVKSTFDLYPWPFETGRPAPRTAAAAVPAANDEASRSAAASALALQSHVDDPPVERLTPGLFPAEPEPPPIVDPSGGPLLMEAPVAEKSGMAEIDAELVDYVFGSTLAESLEAVSKPCSRGQ